MSSPISYNSTLPSYYISASGVSSTQPGATGSSTKDSMSFYEFLNLVGTNTTQSKETIFDNQSYQALMNQDYFLGVAQELQLLSQKLEETNEYAGELGSLTNSYNNSVTSVNNAINSYNNNVLPTLNNEISMMNNAINQLNSTTPPTPENIAAYNQAVAAYNSYLNSTGNPALTNYQNQANSLYNQPTNVANTVTIPAINNLVQTINIGIPEQTTFTPPTAPAGASPLSPLSSYNGSAVAPISPSSYDSLSTLNTIPTAPSETDIDNTYFLPYAKNLLAAIEANGKKFANIDQVVQFINFYFKQGFKLNPSKPDAYIQDKPTPTVPSAASPTAGGSLTLVVSNDTPNLKRFLAAALFKETSQLAQNPLPPHLYDQLNTLARLLLSRAGASAGLSVIKTLGDTLKSLPEGSPVINITTATALLQNILKLVGDGSVTQSALLQILKGIPGISDAEASLLSQKLLTTQNLSLLLIAALSVGVALKNPNLVQTLLNQSLSTNSPLSTTPPVSPSTPTPPPSAQAPIPTPTPPPSPQATIPTPSVEEETPIPVADTTDTSQNPTFASPLDDSTSPDSLALLTENKTNNDNFNEIQSKVTALIGQNLNLPPAQSASLATQAINQTISNLTPNSSQNEIQQLLTASLVNQNIATDQAQSIAQNVASTDKVVATLQSLAPANPQDVKPGQIVSQLQQNIQNVLQEDLTNSLPKIVSETLITSLTDTKDPQSFASLIASVNKDLTAFNDQTLSDEATRIRDEFIRPTLDTATLLQTVWFSSENLTHNFQAGIMYDNQKLPTNFQRPLSIQV